MSWTVKASSFVKRQVKGSGKTYSDTLSFEEIAELAKEKINQNDFRDGYRDGVVLIKITNELVNKFICPLVKIDGNTKLKAKIVKRRPKEENYIQIRAINGKSLKPGSVDLVLYRKDVLDETKERSTNADWELIAFMAIPKDIDMPMGPVTMMRNQLQKQGGTKGKYSPSEWAESVDFWQRYAIKE